MSAMVRATVSSRAEPRPAGSRPLRVAVVCDYREESWPSMDVVADMLVRELRDGCAPGIEVTQLTPRFVRRLSHIGLGDRRLFNADRLLNRFLDYPRYLKARRREFDLFHIIDHSYSHLVPVVGADRTLVCCHDLDTFRCLLEPQLEPRSWPFRMMTARILRGFQAAAAVTCTTAVMRERVLRGRLVAPERLSIIPYGISARFNPQSDAAADSAIERMLGRRSAGTVEILHVGSNIARKRIDVLLRVFAALRREFKSRLIKVGAEFNHDHRELMRTLALRPEAIAIMPSLGHDMLPALYRRADLTLLTSEAEGFGIPMLESMACGTPVVASDLAVLREVGGQSVSYCEIGNIAAWTETITTRLEERERAPQQWAQRVESGLLWAARFSWSEFAKQSVDQYRKIAFS